MNIVMPEFGCQESQLVAYRIAPRHAGLRVLAEHTATTAGRSARCNVSELCFETRLNVFGRDALLTEKPKDSSLVGLHSLNENPKRTDIATIILNVLLM
jgi:hypothetical protein